MIPLPFECYSGDDGRASHDEEKFMLKNVDCIPGIVLCFVIEKDSVSQSCDNAQRDAHSFQWSPLGPHFCFHSINNKTTSNSIFMFLSLFFCTFDRAQQTKLMSLRNAEAEACMVEPNLSRLTPNFLHYSTATSLEEKTIIKLLKFPFPRLWLINPRKIKNFS